MLSMGVHMVDDCEIDPTEVRSGLFALITARLVDMHDIAVKGQSDEIGIDGASDLAGDLRSIHDEIRI